MILTTLEDKKLIGILENPSLKNLKKCTVKELKLLCKDQEIKRSGLKKQLINRLLKHLSDAYHLYAEINRRGVKIEFPNVSNQYILSREWGALTMKQKQMWEDRVCFLKRD